MNDMVFMPHSTCLAGNRVLIKLMNGGDLVIAFSYIFASISLLYVCWKQWDVFRGVSRWFIFSYGLFIISCAATHVMDVVVFYEPNYWTQATIILWTAIVAVPVTIFTIKVVPWFVGLATAPEELASSVNKLQLQVAEVGRLQHKVDSGGLSATEFKQLCAKLRDAEESARKHTEAVNELVGKALNPTV